MPLVAREDPARLRGLLRPPLRGGLLARLPDRRQSYRRRGRHAGGTPLDLAQRSPLRPSARQRPGVDARHRPQPGDRPAPQGVRPLAQARGRGRGAARAQSGGGAHRHRGAAPRDGPRGSRRDQGPSRRSVPGDPARLLRRLQPLGDRGDAERATRDREGPDAARHGQDQGDPGGGLVIGDHPDRDDLVAYSLEALDPREAAAVDAHAPGCARCTRELEALAPAVAVLGESVDQLEPPPELRERVLGIVREEAEAKQAELSGARSQRGREDATRAPRPSRAADAPRGRTGGTGDRRRRSRRLPGRRRERKRGRRIDSAGGGADWDRRHSRRSATCPRCSTSTDSSTS